MSTSSSSGIKRGQALSFRIPSDAPDHVIKQLQKLKETEKRNFSSKIADFVMNGVSHTLTRDRETISIPIPKQLSKAQRDWLKHEHSEALLGSILYQLISDPIRAASLLAALNSNAIDIDQALYLQEEPKIIPKKRAEEADNNLQERIEEEPRYSAEEAKTDFSDDDLSNFDWNKARKNQDESEESVEEEGLEDLLGDFLAQMNK
ncbi:hypothetical protein JOC77_002919 [Peribacillus deserti]|uniref:Uncharacterized protein n=1 Tax=Peribacillus deserti TaxID=673318 RepID=A0ABS2QL35_9BACI|nr:hypothetical protein [Peribacillus deserti]MBM7693479.1 hypothetical protein [Peribacillus deserti]